MQIEQVKRLGFLVDGLFTICNGFDKKTAKEAANEVLRQAEKVNELIANNWEGENKTE